MRTIGLALITMAAILFTHTLTFSSTASAFAECSAKKRLYQKAKRETRNSKGKKFYAYANGTGFTITGIWGCGWAWQQKSARKARSLALKGCKNSSKNNTCKVTVQFRWH